MANKLIRGGVQNWTHPFFITWRSVQSWTDVHKRELQNEIGSAKFCASSVATFPNGTNGVVNLTEYSVLKLLQGMLYYKGKKALYNKKI